MLYELPKKKRPETKVIYKKSKLPKETREAIELELAQILKERDRMK